MSMWVKWPLLTLGNHGRIYKENATYYVGNFETGMSDYYQALVIPQEEGNSRAVVFSYIDNNNQEVRIEEPFTLMVEGAPKCLIWRWDQMVCL